MALLSGPLSQIIPTRSDVLNARRIEKIALSHVRSNNAEKFLRVDKIVDKTKGELHSVIVETARAVIAERGHDPEVRVQVEALIGSLNDTLPDERVLQELEALKAGGPTFQQIFADNSGAVLKTNERAGDFREP